MSWSGRNPVAFTTGRRRRAVRRRPARRGRRLVRVDGLDPEAADQLDPAGLHELLQPGAERAAGRQFVGVAAAVGARLVGAAHAQTTSVPGTCSASSPRSSRVVAAEWPAPTTAVRRPAKRSRSRAEHVGQRVGDAVGRGGSRRGRGCRSRRARSGRRQVPAASITAEASSSVPSARRTRNGASSRPAVRTRSKPTRVTATTWRVVPDPVAQLRRLGQRREVGVDQVAAGRQRAEVGLGPAAGLSSSRRAAASMS